MSLTNIITNMLIPFYLATPQVGDEPTKPLPEGPAHHIEQTIQAPDEADMGQYKFIVFSKGPTTNFGINGGTKYTQINAFPAIYEDGRKLNFYVKASQVPRDPKDDCVIVQGTPDANGNVLDHLYARC